MNNLGRTPAIAVAILAFLLVAMVATVMPGVKDTILQILSSIFPS